MREKEEENCVHQLVTFFFYWWVMWLSVASRWKVELLY